MKASLLLINLFYSFRTVTVRTFQLGDFNSLAKLFYFDGLINKEEISA